ncbi:MAG: universal stress protein [Hyphomicrobiales bacterium]|nr:universal stress protein [Hyphomicrobiales bacterium]MCP4997248.1 universal stress protein [Hyphomicrobiales bacterium]
MFRKIVVGLDGSETSETALRLACDLAHKYTSELHLVHTPQPETVAFALGAVAGYHTVTTMPSSEKVDEATEKIINSGKAIAEEYGQSVKQTHAKRGNPAEEIVACADTCGADLIVTGRRGLGSVGALVQGSTSQRIGHPAKYACLSVI